MSGFVLRLKTSISFFFHFLKEVLEKSNFKWQTTFHDLIRFDSVLVELVQNFPAKFLVVTSKFGPVRKQNSLNGKNLLKKSYFLNSCILASQKPRETDPVGKFLQITKS